MLNFIKKKDFCIVESSAQFFVGIAISTKNMNNRSKLIFCQERLKVVNYKS